MDSKSNKDDVESRLHQTAEAMSERMSSIQEEVSSTGVSLRKWIVQNPIQSVGGMLAVGLAVGLLAGPRGGRRKQHAQLIDGYLNALREEVEETVDQGQEPGPALEKALRDRVPLVVYQGEEAGGDEGRGQNILRKGAGILFSTGLSLLAREVINTLLDNLDVEEIIEEELSA